MTFSPPLRGNDRRAVRDEPDLGWRRAQAPPARVDAAIDLVGGTTAHDAFGLVRDGGRYVTAVPPYVDPSGRFESERDINLHVLTVHPDTGRLRELLALASQGVLSTAVEFTYPLGNAAEAHRRQAVGGLKGRVVLVP